MVTPYVAQVIQMNAQDRIMQNLSFRFLKRAFNSLIQVLQKSSLSLAVGVYGSVAIAAAIISLLLPIETKGKEMPDRIDRNKNNNKL